MQRNHQQSDPERRVDQRESVGNNPRVLVREATSDDAEAIAEVSVESWRAAYDGLMPAQFLNGLSISVEAAGWDRRLTGPDPRGRQTSVAIDGGRVVGFVTSGPDPDDPNVGLVFLMYALPAAWGSGAGDALMAAALRSLQDNGFQEAVLWVLEANLRARRFYERSGWTREGSHRYDDYGGAQLPALRYRLQVAAIDRE
jgi:RimJ/RimL family protein N-acetyltransferase